MAERNDIDNPYSHLCGKGLEHFITHCWETRDVCCRYIAGEVRHEVNEATFQQACNNLLSFRFVGLFEQFETSTSDLLNSLFNTEAALPHHRQSPPSQPTESECSIIEKYNEYDIRLYEYFAQHTQHKPNLNND
jgi:hypothetical protein